MQECREQPLQWTYTRQVVGYTKFHVSCNSFHCSYPTLDLQILLLFFFKVSVCWCDRLWCRKSGNLFNITTIAPSPSPATPPSPTSPKRPFFGPPSTNASTGRGQTHGRSPPSDHPSRLAPQGKEDSFTSKRIVWLSILGAFSFVVLALVCLLCGRKCLRKREDIEQLSKPQLTSEYGWAREGSRFNASMLPPSNTFNKGEFSYFDFKNSHIQ